ncbi:sodium-translocating pyrophosphatase [Salegentibacter mishustinae]|uniref:Putative K(+)-stimulated pyrophosphate-energized sodium pump n=1 Tax=Salegentibacter mishustinae TaxID=270918 RepID=A0A0Q9ZCD3_9FLAO|nr:sodium-translocating pyrophosphatase [Salegentibacter mishustinae]KRG30732.1 inorganic pyrophosphatase [Salegentibacter mishustinae]PNW23621.1 inorganic pyrophosphatase [Salegentibacter mishustinae]PZX66706.1 K(+)-stimulated pyrophosphate-energized sodium pump [Salegentibacter mishustinae]GGW84052.1 putative K(+)-stimulated pyrophosphate-energized sodium pump [Salegentibacter mishustinae]
MESMMIYMPAILAVVGLIFMWAKRSWVLKQDAGDGKMKDISSHIYEGALAFLNAEYKLLSFFVVGASIALAAIAYIVPTTHYLIVVAFIFGAFFSALAGNMGMKIATKTNVRTTQAARTSLPQALKVSFGGGTVMGLGVAGLAVLGLTGFFILFFHYFMGGEWTNTTQMTVVLETLAGFSLGAESIALFARVGGGIYTKAADVGADLVGKVEAGIPEDDPRNPATIADNVGDNVGDVAGMGADLFGSYVATVLAAMVLGNYIIEDMGGNIVDAGFGGIGPILLPMAIAGAGIIISIIGTLLVKISSNSAKEAEVQKALNIGNWTAIILVAVASYFLVTWMLPKETLTMGFFVGGAEGFEYMDISSIRVFYACLVGIVVGGVISAVTEYYTGLGKKPVLSIVQNSSTGAGTNIIAGLATGMISTFLSVLLFAIAIWASYAFAGFYGVALAASAMMATTAMQLAIDAFGPIADNAGGIAEMSELPAEVRERTDILDSVGNTTAATGKGFAIASAALTSLALFAAYVTFTGIDGINIFKAPVLSMLFIGGMVPVVFSALAMKSVGKAAMKMVEEVRRQFKNIPGIMEGTAKPEYDKCVAISTEAALKEMLLPGVLTIGFPIAIALIPMLFGYENVLIAEMLGGYMAGVTVSGVLWAIFQNNAGGAWDNAKKSFEAGVMINGEMTYKGSEAHKAAVTGDTVGDPFKDTSGPSMNILIKLTCLIGLVIAPILGGHTEGDIPNEDISVEMENTMNTEAIAEDISKEVQVNMTSEGGETIAKVRITTTKKGKTTVQQKTFTGTKAEVEKQVQDLKDKA